MLRFFFACLLQLAGFSLFFTGAAVEVAKQYDVHAAALTALTYREAIALSVAGFLLGVIGQYLAIRSVVPMAPLRPYLEGYASVYRFLLALIGMIVMLIGLAGATYGVAGNVALYTHAYNVFPSIVTAIVGAISVLASLAIAA